MSDAAKEQVVTKETGTVKWFNPSKGFGFLRLSGNREDIFVHYSQIQVEGYKTLQQDEPVEFQIEQTPKGFQAVNVTKVTTK